MYLILPKCDDFCSAQNRQSKAFCLEQTHIDTRSYNRYTHRQIQTDKGNRCTRQPSGRHRFRFIQQMDRQTEDTGMEHDVKTSNMDSFLAK